MEDKRNRSILIVDDHPLVRQGLATVIDAEPGLSVRWQTGTKASALELVRKHQPALVIMDLSLEDGSGLDLLKRLRQQGEQVRVLICSMLDEALYAQRALRAGATGFIGKQEAPTRVVEAVRRVLAGHVWVSEAMSARMEEAGDAAVGHRSTGVVSSLSDRELQVFQLIGCGLGPSAIAESLGVSVKTVESHRENIKRKLHLRSGGELNRRAVEWMLEQQ